MVRGYSCDVFVFLFWTQHFGPTIKGQGPVELNAAHAGCRPAPLQGLPLRSARAKCWKNENDKQTEDWGEGMHEPCVSIHEVHNTYIFAQYLL